jgi:hypothetical protein
MPPPAGRDRRLHPLGAAPPRRRRAVPRGCASGAERHAPRSARERCGSSRRAGIERQIDDIGALRAEDARHHAQRSGLVLDHHLQPRRSPPSLPSPQARSTQSSSSPPETSTGHSIACTSTGACRQAHADDAVAGHRRAAGRQREGDAGGEPLHRDRALIAAAARGEPSPAEPGISASITWHRSACARAIASISLPHRAASAA